MSEISLWSDPRVAEVPVVECGEPLVDLRTITALLLADSTAAVLLRLGVAERLVAAQTLLPRGLRLLITGGYRPTQSGSAEYCRQWHDTGAAADVTLSDTDADASPPHRALTDALTAVNLASHPTLWWHCSYGDRYWAFTHGVASARYDSRPPLMTVRRGVSPARRTVVPG